MVASGVAGLQAGAEVRAWVANEYLRGLGLSRNDLNFLEPPTREVRRIALPRTRVNKG